MRPQALLELARRMVPVVVVAWRRDRAARRQPQPKPPIRGPQLDELVLPEPKWRRKLVNVCRTSVEAHFGHTLSLSRRNPWLNTSKEWLHVLQIRS